MQRQWPESPEDLPVICCGVLCMMPKVPFPSTWSSRPGSTMLLVLACAFTPPSRSSRAVAKPCRPLPEVARRNPCSQYRHWFYRRGSRSWVGRDFRQTDKGLCEHSRARSTIQNPPLNTKTCAAYILEVLLAPYEVESVWIMCQYGKYMPG